MIPGEYFIKEGSILLNATGTTAEITVTNTGDRPVQVGSHFHFFEVNRCLLFEREKALGFRLDIAAGTAVRFEPGEEKKVQLVSLNGRRVIRGFSSLVDGPLDAMNKKAALQTIATKNFKNVKP